MLVHSIQVADQTFITAEPADVGLAVADSASWRRWWPDLWLEVTENRRELGVRWAVTGALHGTMEVWLQPMLDGVVLNYFLHAEPVGASAWQLSRMNLARLNHRRRLAGKTMAFEIKAHLEQFRPVGEARLV